MAPNNPGVSSFNHDMTTNLVYSVLQVIIHFLVVLPSFTTHIFQTKMISYFFSSLLFSLLRRTHTSWWRCSLAGTCPRWRRTCSSSTAQSDTSSQTAVGRSPPNCSFSLKIWNLGKFNFQPIIFRANNVSIQTRPVQGKSGDCYRWIACVLSHHLLLFHHLAHINVIPPAPAPSPTLVHHLLLFHHLHRLHWPALISFTLQVVALESERRFQRNFWVWGPRLWLLVGEYLSVFN